MNLHRNIKNKFDLINRIDEKYTNSERDRLTVIKRQEILWINAYQNTSS